MKNSIIYLFHLLAICLLSSCEKCIPTILCPYQNTQYFSVQGSDTATLYFPNAFTPNGDGINDIFCLFGYNIASFQCKIYDASGRQIYESNQLSYLVTNNGITNTVDSNVVVLGGWDGTISGKRADVGIYAVKAIANTTIGTPISLNGTVSIIGAQFLGDNSQNINGNMYLEVKNAQFPAQNRYGVFDAAAPPGEYLNVIQVNNCH